MSMTKQVTFEL